MHEIDLGAWSIADLGSFFLRHRHNLISRAYRSTLNREVSEEIIQDAMIKVVLAAPEFPSEREAFVYFCRTVDNLCIDYFRKSGSRPHLVVLEEAISEIDSNLVDIGDHSMSLIAAEDAAIVRQALSYLSPAERQALLMWELEGLDSQEIAQALGIKERAVRQTLYRARNSLRRVLTDLVIDEESGLTALEALSTSYRKAKKVVEKSAKGVLSLFLLVAAYFGISGLNRSDSLTNFESSKYNQYSNTAVSSADNSATSSDNVQKSSEKSIKSSKNFPNTQENVRTSNFIPYFGLDSDGIPTSFTVTDVKNAQGILYVLSREAVFEESGMSLSFISKTSSTGPNILLNQSITQDPSGLNYSALPSYGRNGVWQPLIATSRIVDFQRLLNGNYLLSVVIQVNSVVDSPIAVPAAAGGRDLDLPPNRFLARIVLNGDKTRVLAQAVMVVEQVRK